VKYALDTNTVILLLREDPHVSQRFNAAVEHGDEIVIPPLVHFEMRRGFLCKSAPKKEKMYSRLIEEYPIGEVSAESLERGAIIFADLYHSGRTVGDVDLLIAAFCMVGGHTLVTNNTGHFEVVEGLAIEDWRIG